MAAPRGATSFLPLSDFFGICGFCSRRDVDLVGIWGFVSFCGDFRARPGSGAACTTWAFLRNPLIHFRVQFLSHTIHGHADDQARGCPDNLRRGLKAA